MLIIFVRIGLQYFIIYSWTIIICFSVLYFIVYSFISRRWHVRDRPFTISLAKVSLNSNYHGVHGCAGICLRGLLTWVC